MKYFSVCHQDKHDFVMRGDSLGVKREKEGRRFISEDRKEGDIYDTLHLETRSQNTEKLSVDQAATVLLNFLQQAKEGADENPDEVYFQELPVWKREFF
ncbi:spexin prohormone 1 isoform X2 [Paralichthys olivaceus]|uniref:spexin prohormone 1 isoform X2 n=1 Tax=Paralichthys olivaceus TaxID=8255 RepID=UPI0037534D3F